MTSASGIPAVEQPMGIIGARQKCKKCGKDHAAHVACGTTRDDESLKVVAENVVARLLES